MKKLLIVVAPHPSLIRVAREVNLDDAAELAEAVETLREMERLLEKSETGIGLAANQVDSALRLVVVNVPGKKSDWKIKPQLATRGVMRMINPRIVWRGGEFVSAPERCLSHPGTVVAVARDESVRVEYRDEYRDEWRVRWELSATGLLARCLQHEIDHLDGISIVDKPGANR